MLKQTSTRRRAAGRAEHQLDQGNASQAVQLAFLILITIVRNPLHTDYLLKEAETCVSAAPHWRQPLQRNPRAVAPLCQLQGPEPAARAEHQQKLVLRCARLPITRLHAAQRPECADALLHEAQWRTPRLHTAVRAVWAACCTWHNQARTKHSPHSLTASTQSVVAPTSERVSACRALPRPAVGVRFPADAGRIVQQLRVRARLRAPATLMPLRSLFCLLSLISCMAPVKPGVTA